MSQSQCLWDCLDVMSVAKCVSLMSHIKLRCFVSCSAGTDPGPFVMAKKQQNLKDLWLSATPGRSSPWQQAKALALREVNMELHGGKVHLSWICARLTKGGGGHPQKGSLHEFFHKVDSVPEWFPGKHSGAKRGPRPLLTRRKRQCMAASAMAAKKRRRQEPCIATAFKA